MTQLTLASTSPRRRELLALLGLPFTLVAPDVDERPLLDETPVTLALRLARAKAETVARDEPTGVVSRLGGVLGMADEDRGSRVEVSVSKRSCDSLCDCLSNLSGEDGLRFGG